MISYMHGFNLNDEVLLHVIRILQRNMTTGKFSLFVIHNNVGLSKVCKQIYKAHIVTMKTESEAPAVAARVEDAEGRIEEKCFNVTTV